MILNCIIFLTLSVNLQFLSHDGVTYPCYILISMDDNDICIACVRKVKSTKKIDIVLTLGGKTSYERIPGIIGVADTYWTMIDHFALSIYSTWIRAGRCTFLIDTSKLQGTLAVHYTFGSAIGWAADKISKARANSETVYILTLTIWSTRGWAARVHFFWKGYMEKNVIIYGLLFSAQYTEIPFFY